MGLVPALTPFVPGTKIMASAVDAKFDAIVAVVNGNLDDSNIDGISANKVTDGEFHLDRIPLLDNSKMPTLDTAKIPRLDETKLPRGSSGKFLKAKGGSADAAYEAIVWGDVGNKPDEATRWPKFSEVTEKPDEATRWPKWEEVTGKPATATSWPTWGQVSGKPGTFAPSAHVHSATDITSGLLDVSRGGTGGYKSVSYSNIPVGGIVFGLLINVDEARQVGFGTEVTLNPAPTGPRLGLGGITLDDTIIGTYGRTVDYGKWTCLGYGKGTHKHTYFTLWVRTG